MNSVKYNEKKNIFIIRLKYAEVKVFSICVDVFKLYESDNYDKLYEVLSTLNKTEKWK